jgi:hypothetical protein
MKRDTVIVYRHIRLDTNVPFYIGIGGTIGRAYSKQSRNPHWINITNKTAYRVEILFEELSWNDACEKEKELIRLYGRIDLGTGILVNMTAGGDGSIEMSPETKSRISTKVVKYLRNRSEEDIRRYKEKMSTAIKTQRENAGPGWQIESNKKVAMGWKSRSDEDKKSYSENKKNDVKRIWANRSEDEIELIAAKIGKSLKGKYLGIPKPQKIVTCPICGKTGGKSNMTRYHFNNCKHDC